MEALWRARSEDESAWKKYWEVRNIFRRLEATKATMTDLQDKKDREDGLLDRNLAYL